MRPFRPRYIVETNDPDGGPIDVFISYSSEDIDHATALEAELKAKGRTVWRDRPRVKPGEHLDFVIPAALRDAKTIVVIWSKNSITSDWVRHEASYATVEGKLAALHVPPFSPEL